MVMGLTQNDDPVKTGTKTKSINVTKSVTQEMHPSKNGTGQIFSEERWSLECDSVPVPKGKLIFYETPQDDNRWCEETRMERINSPEPIGTGGIKIFDSAYKGKPSSEYNQSASSAGSNNDGCITKGLGCVIGTLAQFV
jgi:hypothetical protein